MAKKKISALTNRPSGDITGSEEFAVQYGGTNNYKISIGSLKTWLLDQFITLVTLTGTQTLTNKTLTSPVINSGNAVTVTGTTINLLAGLNYNIASKISDIEGNIDNLDDTVDGIDTRLIAVEGEIEHTYSETSAATGTTFYIRASDIDAVHAIDVNSILCQYYEVNNLTRTGITTDKVTILEQGAPDTGKLDMIGFVTENGKTYNFVIKYKLYTA